MIGPAAGRRDRLAKRASLVLGPGPQQHQRQLARGHLRQRGHGPDQPHQVLPRLEVRHRKEIGKPGRQPQVGSHQLALARAGRLEEQVLGGVGDLGHAILAPGKRLDELAGVELRDGEDQVGLAEGAGQELAVLGGLEPQVLQDVVAGHRHPGLSRRHGILRRAVDPVGRAREPLDRRPGLEPPPPQEVARPDRQLPSREAARARPSRPGRPDGSSGRRSVAARHPPGGRAARAGPGRDGSPRSARDRRPCRRASRCGAGRARPGRRPAQPSSDPAVGSGLPAPADTPPAAAAWEAREGSVPFRTGLVEGSRRPFARVPDARENPEGVSSSDCGIPSPGLRSARAGTTPPGPVPGSEGCVVCVPRVSVTVHRQSLPDPRFTATACQLQGGRPRIGMSPPHHRAHWVLALDALYWQSLPMYLALRRDGRWTIGIIH